MSPSQPTLDTLLVLYRGEAAAVAAYDRALTKFKDQPEEPILQGIAQEHSDALQRLDQELTTLGLKAPESSGAWGAVTNAILTLTSLVADEVPLQVLQRGEEVGIQEYESASNAPGFSAEFQQFLVAGLTRGSQHHERLQQLRDVITQQPNRPMI